MRGGRGGFGYSGRGTRSSIPLSLIHICWGFESLLACQKNSVFLFYKNTLFFIFPCKERESRPLSPDVYKRQALDAFHLPELDYFLAEFLPAFPLTLDELQADAQARCV